MTDLDKANIMLKCIELATMIVVPEIKSYAHCNAAVESFAKQYYNLVISTK